MDRRAKPLPPLPCACVRCVWVRGADLVSCHVMRMMIHHRGTVLSLIPGASQSWQNPRNKTPITGRRPTNPNLARGHNPAPPTLAKPTTWQNHVVDRGKILTNPAMPDLNTAKTDHRHMENLQWLNQASPQTWYQHHLFLASKKVPHRLKSITGRFARQNPFTTLLPSWSMFMNFSKVCLACLVVCH
ncbi:hypothetical protein GmHk_U059946 [Glycine max]|nr:hypothetical protein GmHk_U059946 [Glycine max]